MKKLVLVAFILLCFSFLQVATAGEPKEIHCKHFFLGYPLGGDHSNDLIIRDIYAMSCNDSTKFADWVAYRLTKDEVNGPKRKRNWKKDPWLAKDETLEPKDYKGANSLLETDRGHQAPLASFDGTPDWVEVNYLSNITPQKSDLNRGAWKHLEIAVRRLLDSNEVVYVMTGPIFEREMPQLPKADEEHAIPSGYWKIVVIPMGKKKFKAVGFIFDQDTPANANYKDYVVSIDEIEIRSGLDFFWELKDKKEEKIESQINSQLIENKFK
jgi:endonuclease G, mitochondrial